MKEITDTEVENKEECWILSQPNKLLIKLSFDSDRKEVEVEKQTDGDNVTNGSNDAHSTNDRQHQGFCVLDWHRLAAELRPVGDEPRHGAVGV